MIINKCFNNSYVELLFNMVGGFGVVKVVVVELGVNF